MADEVAKVCLLGCVCLQMLLFSAFTTQSEMPPTSNALNHPDGENGPRLQRQQSGVLCVCLCVSLFGHRCSLDAQVIVSPSTIIILTLTSKPHWTKLLFSCHLRHIVQRPMGSSPLFWTRLIIIFLAFYTVVSGTGGMAPMSLCALCKWPVEPVCVCLGTVGGESRCLHDC